MNLGNSMKERLLALFLITAVEISSAQLLPYVPRNDFYYAACGAFNLLTLSILTVTGHSQITVDLAKLTFGQLFLQFFGWVLYSFEFSPYFYNASIHAIVAVTYLRIIIIGDEDGLADNTDRNFFFGHAVKRPSSRHEVHQC